MRQILSLEKEKESMIFNDTDPDKGFLLNVDPKWKSHPPHTPLPIPTSEIEDCSDYTKDLYCLAICHRNDIRSLRVRIHSLLVLTTVFWVWKQVYIYKSILFQYY